jgi:hypothetical protein
MAGTPQIPSTDMSAREAPRFNEHRARKTTGDNFPGTQPRQQSQLHLRWGRFLWANEGSSARKLKEADN